MESALELVRRHRPIHVSLVGGEPLIRHRELSRILPALGEMGIFPEEKAVLESRSRTKGFRGIADYVRAAALVQK